MEFQIATSDREPIYRQLATQIREGIARGRLKCGDKLPSVRELSRTLVVNPNTIARTYTELERDGVLNTRQGKGVFIAELASELTKSARKRRLTDQIDALLTEAVHLGFSQIDLSDLVSERSKQFQWKEESAK
jgi:GntR family transcriptional regulator